MSFTHFNLDGHAKMVDVSQKDDTQRVAIAKAIIRMKTATLELIKQGMIGKGDVLAVAQVGGIMGAKKTSELIPMCHSIFLSGCDIRFEMREGETESEIEIEAVTRTTGKTGVEMEALTAASVAALTIYDMCKAVDRGMEICHVGLHFKAGGKSGEYRKEKG